MFLFFVTIITIKENKLEKTTEEFCLEFFEICILFCIVA